MIRYRTDIDGLRALAVLPVVLFHLGFAAVAPGGYIGVDVFFVISGFLITRIIYNDMAKGTYSIADFYARRARRILPAAIPVYLATVIAAALLLFPEEREAVVHATLGSIAFVSNFYFYTNTGYFDEAAKLNPMLHTWSLSVEEQFYIVLPVMILVLNRVSLGLRHGAFVLITLGSLAGACLFLTRNPNAVFYLLPFRMWELLFGSLLAIAAIPGLRARWQAEVAAVTGFVLILGSVILLDEYSLFPGWNALPACLGAGLILHAGSADGTTVVARLLSLPPVRFIGLISYSLYLWHWPLIVFAPYMFGEITLTSALALLAVAIALATLSWRFVERPFRSHLPRSASRLPVLGWSAATLVAVAALTLAVLPVASRLNPVSPSEQAMLAQAAPPRAAWREGRCFLASGSRVFDKAACLQLSSSKPNVLLIGDSHAAQYYPGFAARGDLNVLQATASGCRPVLPLGGTRRCVETLDYVVNDWLATNPAIDTVVIAAKWRAGDGPGATAMVTHFRRHVRNVVVLGPITEYIRPLPRLLAATPGQTDGLERFRDRAIPARDVEIGTAARLAGARYVSIDRTLCPDRCRTLTPDGRAMQFDYGHLTVPGSILVVRQIGAALFSAKGSGIADARPVFRPS